MTHTKNETPSCEVSSKMPLLGRCSNDYFSGLGGSTKVIHLQQSAGINTQSLGYFASSGCGGTLTSFGNRNGRSGKTRLFCQIILSPPSILAKLKYDPPICLRLISIHCSLPVARFKKLTQNYYKTKTKSILIHASFRQRRFTSEYC